MKRGLEERGLSAVNSGLRVPQSIAVFSTEFIYGITHCIQYIASTSTPDSCARSLSGFGARRLAVGVEYVH